MSTPRQKGGSSRNRTLAFAGGAVALGGLAWLAYSNLTASKTGGARPPGGPSSHAGPSNPSATKGSKSRSPPPSLSLSLPPTFVRTPANLRLLEQLLTQLCERFVVTLIVPLPSAAATASASDNDLGSVVQLSDTLRHIAHFDARRLLEYSKEDGRLALVRALACDAHCEIMLQMCDGVDEDDEDGDANTSAPLFDDEDDEGDMTIDGDKTPRANSPSPNGRQLNGATQQPQQPNEHTMTSALERYHADVGRIRKSGALLLFLILPIGRRRAAGGNGNTAATGLWLLDVETVLKPFLLPGQISSRLPGVKIIDARLPVAPAASIVAAAATHQRKASRSASSSSSAKPAVKPVTRAWTEAAQRLCSLADGWS